MTTRAYDFPGVATLGLKTDTIHKSYIRKLEVREGWDGWGMEGVRGAERDRDREREREIGTKREGQREREREREGTERYIG